MPRFAPNLARSIRVSTVGELNASLAHEIKQPIAAAMTDAQTCVRWLEREVPEMEEAREAISRVIKDLTWASEIIGRISRLLENGSPQRECFEVNDLVRGMVAFFHTELAQHSIVVQAALADGLPQVNADRVLLQQVLMNLMLNGIESMKEMKKPGTLRIVTQLAEKGSVLISVIDSGGGVNVEQTEHIFQAFFTTKNEGTGMGLAISRSIIESHGGRLWFTPNSGAGVTFQFTLPIDDSMKGLPSI